MFLSNNLNDFSSFLFLFSYTSNLVVIISTFFYTLTMYWECLYALHDSTPIGINIVTLQISQIIKPSFWEIKWLAQGFTFHNRKARIWNHSWSDYKAFLHNQQVLLTLSKFFLSFSYFWKTNCQIKHLVCELPWEW